MHSMIDIKKRQLQWRIVIIRLQE